MSATTTPALLEFGGFSIPAGCRRIFITAELEPSNGDPRIQPTGFPDIGPVLYPDPTEKDGLICLIESEGSMANRLEEVCLADKYGGTLKPELAGLPSIKLTRDGKADGEFVTATTIDGHRFASEYIMGAKGRLTGTGATASFGGFQPPPPDNKEMVEFIKTRLGMPAGDTCPAENVPEIYRLAMEYDPLSLIHGFQIPVKKKLTFVGLRSARALTASIVGLNCDRVAVPGLRVDPIGTGDAGQAIFQKTRITAKKIEARFSIDVGLLTSLRLDAPGADGAPGPHQAARVQLLLAIAIWKVATFLDLLSVELSLRTECKLRLKRDEKGNPLPISVCCEPKAAEQTPETEAKPSGFDVAKIAGEIRRLPLLGREPQDGQPHSDIVRTPEGDDPIPNHATNITVHRPGSSGGRGRERRVGMFFEIEFEGPVAMHVPALGHSCHFGLGLFQPIAGSGAVPPVEGDSTAAMRNSSKL